MRTLLLLVLLLSGGALAQATSSYDLLIERARSGDPELDFRALRQAYIESPGYSGYATYDINPMNEALEAEDWDKASAAARAVLEQNYMSLDAHVVLYLLAARAKDEAAKAQHDYMLAGLSGAIRNDGDGSTPEQPYKVVSVQEEYAVCRMAGWSIQGRALVNEGGKPFDLFTIVDREGVERKIYFDIGTFFGKL